MVQVLGHGPGHFPRARRQRHHAGHVVRPQRQLSSCQSRRTGSRVAGSTSMLQTHRRPTHARGCQPRHRCAFSAGSTRFPWDPTNSAAQRAQDPAGTSRRRILRILASPDPKPTYGEIGAHGLRSVHTTNVHTTNEPPRHHEQHAPSATLLALDAFRSWR